MNTRTQPSNASDGYPLVSVVTPVYNGEKYLEETIKSVLHQTYGNIEYIIIDGGSTDGSVSIIKKYENKISYWLSERDSGMYEAINKGLKIASGDILAYLNSDDIYYPDTVKTAVEYFQKHPDTELIYGNCDFMDHGGKFLYSYRYPGFRWKSFVSMNTSTIPQPTTFWRSRIHKKIDYFDTTLKMCGDFDFYAKAGKCCHIVHINKALAKFRLHSTSLTMLQGYRNMDEVKIIHGRYMNFSRIQQKALNWYFTLRLKLLNSTLMLKKFYLLLKKVNSDKTHG